MPFPNLTLQDVAGSLLAVLAFALVLYAPGYLAAYAVDLFGFRQKNFPERSLWAIACSFVVTPIAAYLSGRAAGLFGIDCLLCAVAAAALLLLLRAHNRAWAGEDRRFTALVAGGWILFVLLMLVELQVGRKLYFSVVMADQSYRIAFTDAVVRTGIPPANPLYFAGAPAPMRYYYFWYVLCAAVVKLAHVSARQAFIASSVWAGFGFIVTAKLFTTHFFRWERAKSRLALGLLLVTGADLIPSLGNAVLQPSLNGDIEWWSVDPIDAWPDSMLWVPHHVASVICCLLGFLLLWRTLGLTSRRDKYASVAFAGLAFASAFGLSVYVAFGFAVLLVAWLLRLAWLRHVELARIARRIAASSLVGLAVLAPFAWELAVNLAHAGTPTPTADAPAPHLFLLSVRRMIDSGLLTGLPALSGWNQAHPVLLDQTIRLFLLIPGLAMELGLYGAVLVLLVKAKHRHALAPDDARDTALFFTIAGLLMTLFLSSSVISNNDFGYRAVMLPQFFLLLLTADVLSSWSIPVQPGNAFFTAANRKLLRGLLVLGVAGSVYGAFLLRAWLPLEMARPQHGFNQLPDDDFQIREAFALLNRTAPRNAVVAFRQIDPTPDRQEEVMTPNEFYQRMLVMDTGRQILNAEGKCATHFGGDPGRCSAIQTATARLYASLLPDAAAARDFCRRFGVQYLVLSHRDHVQNSPSGWPATLPLAVHEPDFNIFSCSSDVTGP